MTSTAPVDSAFRCDCHLKHESVLKEHEKNLDKNNHEHESIWKAVESRVTNKFFIILVMLVVGGLAFQWANYEKLKDIEKNVAVIETKINIHMNDDPVTSYGKTEFRDNFKYERNLK